MSELRINGTVIDFSSWSISKAGSDELGELVIRTPNTGIAANSTPDDLVEVYSNTGERIWQGFISSSPTVSNNGIVRITCKDIRYGIRREDVDRKFFNADPGDIIREIVKNRTVSIPSRDIFIGRDIDQWRTDMPVISDGFESENPQEKGSKCLYSEVPAGTDSTRYLRYPVSGVFGDGKMEKLEIRMLANNRGADVFRCEIEVRDDAGNNFVWDLGRVSSDFHTYELNIEKAETGGELNESGIEVRFNPVSTVSKHSGILIDYVSVFKHGVESRGLDINLDGVDDAGVEVNRDYSDNPMNVINRLTREFGAVSYITADNNFVWSTDDVESGLEIREGDTPVVDSSWDVDYTDMVNRVTVRGDDDVEATVTDNGSMSLYGVETPNTRTVIDESLQDNKSAERVSRNIIEENYDTTTTFQVANPDYFLELEPGMSIRVVWPSQNVDTVFIVESVELTHTGMVGLTLEGDTKI